MDVHDVKGQAMDELVIELAHTPRCLSPNRRVPNGARAAVVANQVMIREKKKAHMRAWVETKYALRGAEFKPTHYGIVWVFKGCMPDADNCLARCKAYLDGCCEAMGVNDRELECCGIERVHDKQEAGRVRIVFKRSLNVVNS